MAALDEDVVLEKPGVTVPGGPPPPGDTLIDAEPPIHDPHDVAPAKLDKAVPPKKRSKKRIALYVVGGLFALLAVTGIFVAIFWDQIARALVERAAADRGIELKAKSVSLSLSEATMKDVDATFPALPGMRVHADSIKVDLQTLKPKKVRIGNLEFDAEDPKAFFQFVTGVHDGKLGGLPAEVTHVKLRVQKISSSIPISIELDAEHVTKSGPKTVVGGISGTTPISGAPFGPYDLTMLREGSSVELTTTALPKVKATIDHESRTVTLSLEKTTIDTLGILAKSPKDPIGISGDLTIQIPEKESKLEGSIAGTFDGLAIPHPHELDGVVFGDQAKLGANFDLSKDGLVLKDIVITQGAVTLKGGAKITLANGGHVETDLEGTVPCSKVAGSVLASKIPGAGLIGGALKGDVGIHLHAYADAPAFALHLEPSAVVRCGIGL